MARSRPILTTRPQVQEPSIATPVELITPHTAAKVLRRAMNPLTRELPEGFVEVISQIVTVHGLDAAPGVIQQLFVDAIVPTPNTEPDPVILEGLG